MTKLFSSKFLSLMGVPTRDGYDYYVATRRKEEDMVVNKSNDEYKTMLPDAVSCFLILNVKNHRPALFLQKEYRFPLGRYVLSPPAGLIDNKKLPREEAIRETAIREVFEETGMKVTSIPQIVSPAVFSTPGMTDESNALVSIVETLDEMPVFNHDNTVGGESFAEVILVDEEVARHMLKTGLDMTGNPYPVYTWAALMWFVSGMWKD